ncbi:zinc-ribbon domain-containing protein [Gymnodinialimonas hymeniacidonis]|uniref:zinc-ribbon domain-containing protein n=1 Tax=Gymnodinialimonas hymeniacidonis TaxID=3126508 RepID=UPI0034C5B9B8
MRLTCPNCSARYEVDESMIPAGGRDVQCSNCSSTWFQPGPRVAAPEPEPEVQAPPPAPDPPAPEPEPQLEEIAVDGPSGAPGEEPGEDTPERPARRQIDAGVADILREEAEREARLRRGDAEPDPVETQSEMPLQSEEDSARSRRLADLEEAEDAFEAEDLAVSGVVAAAASRSELLPDIEEINSTLRATGDRSEAEDDASDVDTIVESVKRRGQVRRGFFLILLLAAIGVAVYVYADEIAAAVPQLESALESYVNAVNSARFWLDDMARSIAGGATGSGE